MMMPKDGVRDTDGNRLCMSFDFFFYMVHFHRCLIRFTGRNTAHAKGPSKKKK